MKHLIDRLQIAQGNNNADELIPEVIEMLCQQQSEIEELKEKDLRKSMAIRSLNTQLKKALQYKTFSNMAHKNPVKTLEKIGAILRKAQEK